MANPSVMDTLGLITELHEGQVDKLGAPYYFHPIRVMLRLGHDATEAEKLAALLHDVLEDIQGATAMFLSERGYSEEVIDMCQILKREKGESYQAFIARIIASGNIGAIRIKLADLYDNTNEDRAVGASNAVRAQLADMAEKRYRPAIARLKLALGHLAANVYAGALVDMPEDYDDARLQVGRWEAESRQLSEGSILSRFPIRVIQKQGLFTPWYLPMFWFARSGVFAFPPFIAVTKDVVQACPAALVRPILAHEIGHLRKLHSVFWFAFIFLFFQLIGLLIEVSRDQFGQYGPLAVFLVMLLVAGVATFRIQHWFELSADDYAVQVAGLEPTIMAIKWAKQHIHGDRTVPWVDGRIARLEAQQHATH